MRIIILSLLFVLLFVSIINADFSQEKIEAITKEMQIYFPSWDDDKTIQKIQQAKSTGSVMGSITNGKVVVSINIIGDSFIINGKDVTGNLGKKEIHQPFSHLFEKVEIKITIFSITFISISFIVYLFFRRKKKI